MSRKVGIDVASQKAKQEEEELVHKLLIGELLRSNSDVMKVEKKFLEAGRAELHDEEHDELHGRAVVIPTENVSSDGFIFDESAEPFDTERSKQLVGDAGEIASTAIKNEATRAPRKAADTQKAEESYYFRYEKLHDEQEDVEQSRKDLGVDRFEGNFLGIKDILMDGEPGKFDDKMLGNWDTFNNVQHLLQNVFVRKHLGSSVDSTSSGFLAQLREKLAESRDQLDASRKKVKELGAALGVAAVECKSAQQLLAERNEDVNRLRNTINVLQLQIRNFKLKQATMQRNSDTTVTITPGSKEELLHEIDQLRTEYQDLCDVNAVLEKENHILRIRAEMRPPTEVSETQQKFLDPSRQRTLTPEPQKKAVVPLPMAKAMMAHMEERREAERMREALEENAMRFVDFDGGYVPPPVVLPRREVGKELSPVLVDVGVNTIPIRDVQPVQPAQPTVKEPESTTPQLKAVTPPPPPPPPDDSPAGWKQSAKAWMALRRTVLANVVLSRAEALRREEAHTKKMRARAAQLLSDLSQVTSARDALQERTLRVDRELEASKEQTTSAQRKIDELVVNLAAAEETIHNLKEEAERRFVSMSVVSVPPPPVEREPESPADGNEVSQASSRTKSVTSVQSRERVTLAEPDPINYGALISVLNDKIQRLEASLQEKNAKVEELMQIVGGDAPQKNEPKPSLEPVFAEPVAMKRLEKEMILKDQELLTKEQDLKLMQVKLVAVEDQLTEERAVVALGLSRKAATRVVSVLRRILVKARSTLEERRNRKVSLSPSVEVVTATEDPFLPQASSRDLKMDAELNKGPVVEEDMDEEELILKQLLSLTSNPLQRDLISKQLSALELEDRTSLLISGRSIAKREKDWYMMRRLWLRLLSLRETAWHEAMTEEFRAKLTSRLTDTYEAFLRFEQNDSGESRPSMASNGAIRVVSQTASPITQQTGVRSPDEIEREYTALLELVKTRNAQQLQLESQRDELVAQIDRMSEGIRGAKKEANLPSALFIRHTVKEGETAAIVGAMYAITNFTLLHDAFLHAPRSANDEFPDRVWIPLRTEAALATAMESSTDVMLVCRHLLTSNDTFASVATLYKATPLQIRRVGATTPLGEDENVDDNFACLDVIVSREVASDLLNVRRPSVATEQWQSMVFAVFPTPKTTPRCIAFMYNVAEEELNLLNTRLEKNSDISIPLLLTRGTIAMLPEFIRGKRLFLSHTVRPQDTLESIAERNEVAVSALNPYELKARRQMKVPIWSASAILKLVQNPTLRYTIEKMMVSDKHEHESPALVRKLSLVGESSMRRLSVSTGPETPSVKATPIAADMPLLKLDRSISLAGVEAERNMPHHKNENRETTQLDIGDAAESASEDLDGSGTEVAIEYPVTQIDKLENIATRLNVLREELEVPNCLQLKGSSGQRVVRIRDFDSLHVAQTSGYETFGLIRLDDESIEQFATSVSVAPRLILEENPELCDLSLTATISSKWVRVPLMNRKVQSEVLRRSAYLTAVVPIADFSVEELCKTFRISSSDISAYDVDVDPVIASRVVLRRFRNLRDAVEFRIAVHVTIDAMEIETCPPDVQRRLRGAIEKDVWNFVDRQQAIESDGNLIGVQVCSFIENNKAVTHVISSGYNLALGVKTAMETESRFSPMMHTQEVLLKANPGLTFASALTLQCSDIKIFGFPTTQGECIVVGVGGTDTLASIALAHGIGISDLFAFNPSVQNVMFAKNPADSTTASLAGVSEIKIPLTTMSGTPTVGGTRDRTIAVSPTDTFAGIAELNDISVEVLRRHNFDVLPLSPFVGSLRVPIVPSTSPPPSMLVKAQSEESVLSWCTRFGLKIESVDADLLELSPGTVLQVPARVGMATSGRSLLASEPCERIVDRGEKLHEIAADLGLLPAELILCNPSRVRIGVGATVCLPVSAKQERVVQTGVNGLFVRHTVQTGDTLPTISAAYFQPMTTVLAANPSLYSIPGAHLILVPLPEQDRHDLFATNVTNICTIVKLRHSDNATIISKRFQIPIERINELNALFKDNSHMVIPVTSPAAVSIARHQELPLFAIVQLHYGESFVTLADRYRVFVKDLLILGKPLESIGVSHVDIPVSYDVAKRVQASPVTPSSRVILSTSLRMETLSELIAGLAVEPGDLEDTLGRIEVTLDTQTSLERARDRETSMLMSRSGLIERTHQIHHALRQLGDRNDATLRELEKVGTIREQNRLLNLAGRARAINTDSIGVQTDEIEKPQVQRRHNTCQTRIVSDYFDHQEAQFSVAKARIAELEANVQMAKEDEAQMKVGRELLEKRIIELGLQLQEKSAQIAIAAEHLSLSRKESFDKAVGSDTMVSTPPRRSAATSPRQLALTPQPHQPTPTPSPEASTQSPQPGASSRSSSLTTVLPEPYEDAETMTEIKMMSVASQTELPPTPPPQKSAAHPPARPKPPSKVGSKKVATRAPTQAAELAAAQEELGTTRQQLQSQQRKVRSTDVQLQNVRINIGRFGGVFKNSCIALHGSLAELKRLILAMFHHTLSDLQNRIRPIEGISVELIQQNVDEQRLEESRRIENRVVEGVKIVAAQLVPHLESAFEKAHLRRASSMFPFRPEKDKHKSTKEEDWAKERLSNLVQATVAMQSDAVQTQPPLSPPMTPKVRITLPECPKGTQTSPSFSSLLPPLQPTRMQFAAPPITPPPPQPSRPVFQEREVVLPPKPTPQRKSVPEPLDEQLISLITQSTQYEMKRRANQKFEPSQQQQHPPPTDPSLSISVLQEKAADDKMQKELSTTVEAMKRSISQIVEAEAERRDQLNEEVTTVMDVIKQLEIKEMSGEQRQQVQEIRQKDEELRKKHVKTTIGSMARGLHMHRLAREPDLDSGQQKKVIGLWKSWLSRWTYKRNTLERERNENMKRLLNVFVFTDRDEKYSGRGPMAVSVPQSPRSPHSHRDDTLYRGLSPSLRAGIFVFKRHAPILTPQFKLQKMQPPSVNEQPSSQHFDFAFTAEKLPARPRTHAYRMHKQ